MAKLSQVNNLRVFVPRPPKKSAPGGAPKRFGRVHNVVFSPAGTSVVGLMVKRPDVAGMVKRPDEFAALDRLSVIDEGLMVAGDDAWGPEAARRLALDLDRCLIWQGMDVVCDDGQVLGRVVDVEFDLRTGQVAQLLVSDGALAQSLVGATPITAQELRGYADGAMRVANAARDLALTGGLAAKAGEAAGRAQQKAGEAAAKAGEVAGEALDKGSFALGKAIGTAKRAVREAAASQASDEEGSEAPAKEPLPPLYVPTGETSPVESTPEPKAAKPEQDGSRTVAHAVGRQLGKSKSMFGAFVKEFKDASR